MSGVTSTTFGLLIAYLLPGLIAFFGISLWSPPVAELFSTFLTSQSNAGLFLLVLLAALVGGLFLGALRWLLLDRLLCRWMFGKDRILLGIRTPQVPPPSPTSYASLAKDQRLTAYRAFIEEIYRHYQFWGGTAIAMPIVLLGWLVSLGASVTRFNRPILIGLILLVESLVVIKALDSFVSVSQGHQSILNGGGSDSTS